MEYLLQNYIFTHIEKIIKMLLLYISYNIVMFLSRIENGPF